MAAGPEGAERPSRRRAPLVAALAVPALVAAAAVAVVVVRGRDGAPPLPAPAAATATGPASAPSAPSAPSGTGSPAPAGPVVVAAAGDLVCDPQGRADEDGGTGGPRACGAQGVAALVRQAAPAAFLPLGDVQYEDGRLDAFRRGYDPVFGSLLPVTHPVPGNHEYGTRDAAGYFDYFGARAGEPGKGWYALDVGGWHLVALNSNCDRVDCSAGGEQDRWLRADLAAHPAACTLAYWHHPRWSSGEHGDDRGVADLVATLAAGGVDVVLSGHDHDYERFRPQDAQGRATAGGVRAFVVGTGGRSLREVHGEEGTEIATSDDFGALLLTLGPAGYSWQFRTVHGRTADQGTGTCH